MGMHGFYIKTADTAIHHKGQQIDPQMHVAPFFGQPFLKIPGKLHKLVDHMGDLTALVKIFHSPVRVAAILMANVVAVIFLPVKTLVFNFPSQAPIIAYCIDILPGQRKVGDICEFSPGCPGRGSIDNLFI